MNTFARTLSLSFLLISACFSLSACGVKPKHVSPPSGTEVDHFPAVYPAPVTKIQQSTDDAALPNK